jgi:23S rRNA (cytosine1962-C5)-methyltransferase
MKTHENKIADKQEDYALLDSGNGRKLERFGSFIVSRPASQAVWNQSHPCAVWESADAVFTREGDRKWLQKPNNDSWTMKTADIQFKIQPTDFGHLGVFPEQKTFWQWIQNFLKTAQASGRKQIRVLNLFAYSGGSTLAAAKAGAEVCHLDASKGMVTWARENATLNELGHAPIRWIIDDAGKFLAREVKRGVHYDAIILDPPSFGRGAKGEVFKIEDHLPELLRHCRALLSNNPLFILFSCHTPGFTPLVMHHLLGQMMNGIPGTIDCGEMVLEGKSALPLPSGTFARWIHG